jgi:hypothetical protein
VQLPEVEVLGLALKSALRYAYSPRFLLCPVVLIGAVSLVSGCRVQAGEAIAQRRPQGGLDAAPASWTIGSEEDGPRGPLPVP